MASPLRRLLIVDDNAAVREALRWALEDTGDLLVVGEAGTGGEALGQAAMLQPDVVILDIELPDLDGYTVSRRLKSSSHPPGVVFLSVHSDPTAKRLAREAGGDAFIDKGAGWAALINQVRRVGRLPGAGDG